MCILPADKWCQLFKAQVSLCVRGWGVGGWGGVAALYSGYGMADDRTGQLSRPTPGLGRSVQAACLYSY